MYPGSRYSNGLSLRPQVLTSLRGKGQGIAPDRVNVYRITTTNFGEEMRTLRRKQQADVGQVENLRPVVNRPFENNRAPIEITAPRRERPRTSSRQK